MNCRNILKKLESGHFTKIQNQGKWFEERSVLYFKEIRKNIFLLFVALEDPKTENIRALIAHFDAVENIGQKEPEQVLFYLSIQCKEDLHYFEKYLYTTENELITV